MALLQVDVKQFISTADGTRRYAWQTISADEALKIAEPRMRCPECKGAIGLFRRSADDAKPNRAEHKKKLAANPIEPNEESVPGIIPVSE
jgi:hypothetical protein